MRPSREQMERMLAHAGVEPIRNLAELRRVFKLKFGILNRNEANQYLQSITKTNIMTTSTNNTPTDQQIVDAAKGLMALHGSTTTLDTKNELRVMGFWVDQNQVSNALAASGLEWRWNNGHRVYYVSTLAPQFAPATPQNGTAASGRPGRKPSVVIDDNDIVDITKVPAVNITSMSPDLWVVRSVHKGKVIAYPANETRDHVRAHFARITGNKIQDVRACRLNKYVDRLAKILANS